MTRPEQYIQPSLGFPPKCLDSHWIPEPALGPTDKRVDSGLPYI